MSIAQEKELAVKAINRGDNFTLAQKRVMRNIVGDLYDELEAVDAAATAGINSIQLYGNDLLYGSVTWISGLTFEVSECRYIIDDVTYVSAPATITLDEADGDDPRIDVIYVDTSSTAGKITGTAAADPAKPEVDAPTQLELTFVTVAATATEPSGITATALYLENAGDPGEWDATESTSAARITLGSTAAAYAGTKSIFFNAALAGDKVTLTSGGAALAAGDVDFLELHVRASSWANAKRLRVAAFSGVTRVSNWVLIRDGNFGFNRTNTSDFQTVSIPGGDFAFTGPTFDSIQLEVEGGGGALSAYVDNIRVQTGGGVTPVGGFTEEQMINNVRTWNAQQPFGTDTLTDAASIVWDLDSQPVATVTLDGNRTLANPTGIRAGGTYILKVVQDDTTGSRTLGYGSAFLWPGGTAPTLSTAVDSVDILTFVSFDGTNLYGLSSLDFQ